MTTSRLATESNRADGSKIVHGPSHTWIQKTVVEELIVCRGRRCAGLVVEPGNLLVQEPFELFATDIVLFEVKVEK